MSPHNDAPDLDGPARPGTPPEGDRQVDELVWLRAAQPAAGVRLVRVGGELDLLSSPRLEACLAAALDARPHDLIIDLSDVDFLGSMGLAALLVAHTRAAERRIALHLTGIPGNQMVARALEITGLATRFDTHPSLDALLDTLRPG